MVSEIEIRKFIIMPIASAIMACCIAIPAWAQEINGGGALRMVSLYDQLEAVCNPIMPLNLQHAHQYKQAAASLAKKLLGPKDFRESLPAEMERRKSEVAAVDAKKWCAERRASIIKLGVTDVFE